MKTSTALCISGLYQETQGINKTTPKLMTRSCLTFPYLCGNAIMLAVIPQRLNGMLFRRFIGGIQPKDQADRG